MLAIRMQRTGRRGHAQFRVIVQDSRFSPKSGRVVAYVGNYNPHSKTAALDSEKISKYLENGAQPSDRVARLLKQEGVKLPKWVIVSPEKKRAIRHPEKLRRNRPAEENTSTESSAPADPTPTVESEALEETKEEQAQETTPKAGTTVEAESSEAKEPEATAATEQKENDNAEATEKPKP